MGENHDGPFPDDELDAALAQAWGAKEKAGESVVARLERMPGVASRIHLDEPAEEASAPVVRVGATEGADRSSGDSRYQLVGEIARGGVGIIYRGRDKDLGRDVALKVLRPEHAGKDFVITRFIEEAQIGAQLQHPGIVPVYSLGLQPDGRPHFAMKLVKGRTLGALLDARRTPSEDRRRFLEIFLQTCQTVSYAHARGVLHRDLKPANVMVGAFGEVLVVDWGFGKVLGHPERTAEVQPPAETIIATVRTESAGSQSLVGSVMGTLAYMPPEQAMGHVHALDARSDVFSLGAILCEVLTGKPPYVGDQQDLFIQASQARLDGAFERLATCDADAGLQEIVRRCLAPVPSERPADAGVVAAALGDWMAAADERADRAEVEAVEEAARLERSRARATWERGAKRRLRLGAIAASLALLLGAGALWLVDARQHERSEAARPGVEQALLEAAHLQGQDKLARALGVALRARDLAHTADVGGELEARAGALLTELEAAHGAQQVEAERAREAEAFAKALTDIQLGRWEGYDERHTDEEFAQAFATRDLDPLTLSAEEVASRVKARFADIRVELASALDAWGLMRWHHAGDWKLPARVLTAAAQAIDPDALRSHIRIVILEKRSKDLREIATEQATADLPGPTVYLLGTALAVRFKVDGVRLRKALLEARLLRHPDDFWVHAYLSSPSDPTDRDELETALDHATAAVALRPHLARAHSQLAQRYTALGRHATALAIAEEAARLAPDDAGIQNNYGVAASGADDLVLAERAWRRAVELDPRIWQARSNLAGKLSDRGQHAEAIAAYREILARHPRTIELWLGLATTCGRAGRVQEGSDAARKAVALDADSADAWVALAYALIQARTSEQAPAGKLLQEALAAARKAVELAPNLGPAHACLALAYVQAEQWDQVEGEARKALRLDPTCYGAHIAIGRLAMIRGDIQGALTAFDKALNGRPWLKDTALRRGYALLNLERFAEAEGVFRGLLAEHPTPGARIALASALINQNQLDEAEDWIAKVGAEDRRKLAFPFNFALAQLHEARGEDDAAVACFRKALNGNPRWIPTYFRLARLFRKSFQYDEMIEVCQRGLAFSAKDARLHNLLGIAYLNTQRLAEAKAAFLVSIQGPMIDADRGVGYMNLGVVALNQGEPAEALEYLGRVPDLVRGHAKLIADAERKTREATRKVELLALLPGILAGTQTLESEEDLWWAWQLYWHRDQREATRTVLGMAESRVRFPAAWWVSHARTCIASCSEQGLRIPLEPGEDVVLRQEALGLMKRAVAAARGGTQHARSWVKWAHTEKAFAAVREPEGLKSLPPEERAAWTALWTSVDEVLATSPKAPAGKGDGTGKDAGSDGGK